MAYVRRFVDEVLDEVLSELPAVLLTGPRACGKKTTATRRARSIVRLDHEGEAEAFIADPDVALRGLEEPVLIDEWQVVPSALGAVKRAVDTEPRGGRFLITGSVRAQAAVGTWPGTGRIVRVPMFGMTQREIRGDAGGRSFDDRVATAGAAGLTVRGPAPDLRGYVDGALVGGFPEPALRLSGPRVPRWLDGYIEQLVTRDVEDVDRPRDPARLRRYLEALAVNTASVVDDKTLYEAAGIDRKTAVAYQRLLVDLSVLDVVRPWWTNRLKRLIRSPKRYLTDTGLVGAALGVDTDAVMRNGRLLGPLLDTYVAAQLRPEIAVGVRGRVYHLRQEQGRHEVDLLIERAGGATVAIEVKATSAPKPSDARHLAWLRDALGDRFAAGVVMHTGPRTFELGDRLVAAPICSIWTGIRMMREPTHQGVP